MLHVFNIILLELVKIETLVFNIIFILFTEKLEIFEKMVAVILFWGTLGLQVKLNVF